MKIGIDIRILSWNWTGPWRYLRNLLDHIARIDRKNEYFLYLDKNLPELMIAQSNFKKTLIGSLLNGNRLLTKLNTGLSSKVIESYLKAQALDPILGNLFLPVFLRRDGINVFHSPFNALPLAKVCPSVVTIHDLAFEFYPKEYSTKARIWSKVFTPLAARRADTIIVPSACVKENIVQLYDVPQSKVRVIHEAADEIFKPMNRQESKEKIVQKYHIEDEFMLFIGFARLRRNVPLLLKAFLKLKKQYSIKHKLVIVGRYDSVSTNYPKLIRELGIEKDVFHFGHIPDEDLPLLYNGAEIFVYPSSYEGFGLPLVEAMACGTPIVASNAAPMPEIIGKAGLFVDPFNVSQMAQTIYDVLADENLRLKLREESLERSHFFSWEKTARNTLEAYADALRNRTSS
jgi:glycosyltransferase involved in cell wall biosynthesis